MTIKKVNMLNSKFYLLSLLFLFLLLGCVPPASAVDIWDGSTATTWTVGSGTLADPHKIESAAHLAYLAQQVNGGMDDYAGEYFELTADLNLNGHPWMLIGKAPASNALDTNNFKGHFNGKEYTIYNLAITDSANDGVPYGLFGVLRDGSIKNLNLVNVKVEVTGTAPKYTAGLVGQVSGDVENCTVTGTIKGVQHVGGLVGILLSGKVTDCVASVDVKGENNVGGLVGGVVGNTADYPGNIANMSISRCVSIGSVTDTGTGTSEHVGGLVGSLSPGYIEDSLSLSNVDAGDAWNRGQGFAVGGLVGFLKPGMVENSAAYGSVQGNDYVGGLVGSADSVPSKDSAIRNSFSAGYTDGVVTLSFGGCEGGLVGFIGSGTVPGCVFDRQGSVQPNGIGFAGGGQTTTALATSALTTGTKPTALGGSWTCARGYYPVPTALATHPTNAWIRSIADLAAVSVAWGNDTDTAWTVKASFKLRKKTSSGAPITWTWSGSTGTLRIGNYDDDEYIVGLTATGKPTLTATIGSTVKSFLLTTTAQTALWEISFNVDGGSPIEPRYTLTDNKVAQPSQPTKSGFQFAGWYRESTFITPWNFDTDVVTADITLYARWLSLTNVQLDTLLVSLNAALRPHSVKQIPLTQAARDAIAATGTAGTVEITKALAGDTSFAQKTAPAKALDGYTNPLPSFASSVNLNANTIGNALALAYTLNVIGITGLENWANLDNNARVALLNNLNVIFAYEFASGWKTLVGTGGVSSWGDALAKGIISFSNTGVTFNYAVIDATGDPFVAGNVIAIPDGAKDNKLIDPVWLMKKKTTEPVKIIPTAVTLSKSALEVKQGESATVTAIFTPTNATERELVWTVANSRVAQIDKTAQSDVYKVTGVAEGSAKFTALVSADRTVKATLEVTVTGIEEPDPKEAKGGCDSGIGFSFLAVGAFWIFKRQGC